jgi:hypothetical protein
VRDRDERPWVVRPLLADDDLDDPGEAVRGEDGDRRQHEHENATTHEREHECEHEPDQPVVAELRQPDEDIVQRLPAVLDDPPLCMSVPAGQTGAIVFVWSISCCRSNGLPMNPCAPFAFACCCASSSTLPLNMTTGIAPAP